MAKSPTDINAEYQTRVVALIDVLGFRALVADASASDIRSKIGSINIFKNMFNSRNAMEPNYCLSSSFSDLIVLAFSCELYPRRGDIVYLLHNTIRYIGWSQFMLACRGVFVRGGLCIGNIFMDEFVTFGPALIRAYDIERLTAIWPVVAFDPELISRLDDIFRAYIEQRVNSEGDDGRILGLRSIDTLNSFIKKTDTHSFVDYIGCFAYEDSTTGDLDYYLHDHRKAVIKANAAFPSEKYEFIAAYHDEKCLQYGLPGCRIGPLKTAVI